MKPRRGDFVLVAGGGLAVLLQAGLGLVEPDYAKLDWKPWHMAMVVRGGSSPLIFEGWFPRARVVPIQTHVDYRVYHWFSHPISQQKVDEFMDSRLGALYDPACYIWTIASRAFRIPVPRVNDRFFTCWELAADFALWFGEPWHDMYTWPLITDFLKAVGEIGGSK